MTGTPVENRLSELHSIMDFLNPGLLGSPSRFQERFANPIERYRDGSTAARLRQVTGPFILRRLKTDTEIIDDLPEKIEMRVDCHLSSEQATPTCPTCSPTCTPSSPGRRSGGRWASRASKTTTGLRSPPAFGRFRSCFERTPRCRRRALAPPSQARA